ncbi:MAG: hypothetical protein UY21_C0010G0003 [Microgenomates group bacterium GW2011_GWA1_48_10]|nr:MAG: hypothetical protein UY21_C0010G0003 [Microgenomates group bacterium GW2011_GWA1_48_10]
MSRRLALPIAIIASFLTIIAFLQLTKTPSLRLPIANSSATTELSQILREQNLAISSPLTLTGTTATAFISGLTVFFSLDKDINTQVRTLQLVLGRTKIEARAPKEIDLRYNKVVIRY